MKHIGGSIMVALLSMTMAGCIFEKSSRTPLEFSSTAPTTAVVGQEYRYDITVTPESERDYEITIEGQPDWLELQTEASLPIKVGGFEGVVPYMAADGEDIYFYAITSSFGLPGFWIYKTRIDSNEEPQSVFNPSAGFEGFGGLTINNRVLYIAENKARDANASTVFHKLNLADSNPQPEVIREVPGHTISIAVKDSTLYWTDGGITRKYFSFNDTTKINELVGLRNWQTLGTDAYGFIHVATTNSSGYFLVELTTAIRPMYASGDSPCTAGIAGYANQGTYFANTTCYSNGEQKQGNLRFVAVDGESDTNSSGTVVYREGEIIAGSATAVTVTGSGQVVWASEAERSLKTFSVQQNTLVGTPTEAGTYEITLTLPGGATQEFTLTVTEPPVSYDVTGTVYGLQGVLQLSNNDTDVMRISTAEEGSSVFSFTKRLQQGEAYDVTVLTNPAGQTCSVRDESAAAGTMGTADVELIADCEFNSYSISGTVEGLNGELELLLSSEQGDEDLLVSEDGAFSFAGDFILGDEYSVTIQTQPAGQVCELNVSFTDENGEATNPLVSGPVDLPISCTTDETPRTLSVTVTGLPGDTSVEMRAFGPQDGRWDLEDKAFATGTAAFSNTLLDSEAFAIGILTQPDGYSCIITDEAPLFDIVDGLGIVDGDVTITVSCAADAVATPRTLSVTVVGLPLDGTTVFMGAVGPGFPTWVSENKEFATGTAAFDNTMLDGEMFDISVVSNPGGFTCNITDEVPLDGGVDGFGEVDGDVTITVSCAADVVATPRTLSVTVAGLPGGTTVAVRAFGPEDARWLQEDKAFATGTGSFNNTMLDGEIFDIRIIADPDGFTCNITDEVPLDAGADGFGTVDGDVTITVTCG